MSLKVVGKPSPLVVIVTGLSGAGNSTALHALADGGMYCIDNLPVELIGPTIDFLESGRIVAEHGLGLCMDVRDSSFAGKFSTLRRELAQRVRLEVLFLTADMHVLATRFGATRRKHPLQHEGETLIAAIERERDLLGPVEEASDVVFDTSLWTPQQLARAVERRIGKALPERLLHVTVTSFGFKYGQANPVDTLFDVRFIDNPYFVPDLRNKSGLDPEVRDFIFSHQDAAVMLAKMEDLLRFVLPNCYREGKHYFRVGIGCTGGRHRSVCFAEKLGEAFRTDPIANMMVTVIHRDIEH